jgi:eukaryotic-like serine/threonine-protein kinase
MKLMTNKRKAWPHPSSLILSFMTPEQWEQVGQLYQAALELRPEERAAYLDRACAADRVLRLEVESLLAADSGAADFLAAGAMQDAANLLAREQTARLAGQSFGHYQVLALIGAGGMGEVYCARDVQLERQVALKVLPARFTQDAERLQRFVREAKTASALNHPNIITIYEIGAVGATHFIATEFIEGETLRQRLAGGSLELHAALDVAIQVAAALEAAHRAGIVHRDIKPENVMARPDGLVKVLDFGLAKLLENDECGRMKDEKTAEPPLHPSSFRIHPLTEPGVVMGTVHYMSPEQARGEKVDARTDIFSLGALTYEMITGHAPFAGATTSEVIAAILRDAPPPLGRDAPPELERIVGQALCKNREQRYQTASELSAELKLLRRELEFAAEEKHRSGRAGAVSGTPNKRRHAAISALAGLIIAAMVAWFYFNRAPILTDRDTILLADFENKTGEEIFDKMLKQGLAIQLQQSPFLNLFPEAQMRHELTLMRRPPDARVTAELAREICQRQNLKALIAGSIAPLGSHYVITLEALNGQSGETLAHEQIEAASKEQVLRALSQAATRLRKQLGESLNSIQRFDRPLQEGTTAKPEAFKAYSQAIELAVSGRLIEAIPFYQRAVELDSDFASAYSQLAIMYWTTNRPGLAAEYAKKSYELKDRAGEIEKFRITHTYHRLVTGDLNKTIEVLRLQRRTYPREWTGPLDLAAAYNLLGQSEKSVAEAREAIHLNPNFAAPYIYIAAGLLRLNRFAEAKDVLVQAFQQGLDHTNFHFFLYQLAFINSDTTGMQQQLDWAIGKPDEYVAFDWQAGAAGFGGQWRKAQDFARRAIDLAARGNTVEVAARYAIEQALLGAVFGDCRQANTVTAQGLKLARGRATLPRAALALALCGVASQAQPLVEDIGKRYPEDTLLNSIWLPVIRAGVELQRGNATQALEQLQAATRYEAAAEFWPPYLRGQAYLQLKQGSEAAAEFQKVLAHRGYAPLSPLYPLAHLGLARAAALTGDTAQRRKAYEDFFAMWKEADADLPILRTAKREYDQLR